MKIFLLFYNHQIWKNVHLQVILYKIVCNSLNIIYTTFALKKINANKVAKAVKAKIKIYKIWKYKNKFIFINE